MLCLPVFIAAYLADGNLEVYIGIMYFTVDVDAKIFVLLIYVCSCGKNKILYIYDGSF